MRKTFLFLALLTAAAVARGDHIQDLGRQAAQLRGLSYRPVVSQVVSQKECVAYVMKLLDQEMTPPRVRKREIFLRQLGLLAPSRGLKEVYSEALADQVRGLYDPAKKRYLVVKGGGAGEMEGMLQGMGLNIEDIYTVHELGHAIQDQHFNLTRMFAQVEHNYDEELAVQSLVEGDATILMMDYALKSVGMEPGSADMGQLGGLDGDQMMMSSPAMARAPRFVRDSMTFPYGQGAVFVQAMRARGGWKNVDRVFANPPESSEQILHPEKYGRDHPRKVQPAAPPLGSDYKKVGRDTAGEFLIGLWAKENGGSAEVASGWGGDAYEVYVKGDQACTVWDTYWDSPKDASEFEQFVVKAFNAKRGAAVKQDNTWVWRQERRLCQCDRKGTRVQIVLDYPRK